MRCKAHFCNGTVDFMVDEQGELCPKCMASIYEDLPEKIAKRVRKKFDDAVRDQLRLDDLDCDD